MAVIEITNLTKKYKETMALKEVSLSVKKGELFGLLGENGAGKTTLIKILCGLTKKTEGRVIVNGLDLDNQIDKIKEIIGISPQENAVAQNLTVEENLQFFANVYNSVNSEYLQQIIEVFSLKTVLNKKAKTLSGGYNKRLSVAIALISKPIILFLDEPTLGLDVVARRKLWEIIKELKGKITIILTSHYLEEIENLCDRVAILSNGKLLEIDTVENLKQKTGANTFEDAFVELVGKEGEGV